MKTLLAIMMLALATQAKAGDNDTIVIKNPSKVTVITGDSLQKIIVRGREGDDKYVYRNTIQLVDSNYVSNVSINKDRWELLPKVSIGNKDGQSDTEMIGKLAVGWAAPTKCDPDVDISNFRSWEIWLNVIEWRHHLDKRKSNTVTLGLGVDWRNYRMTGNRMFSKSEEGSVEVVPYPDDARPKFSRIKVFSWTGQLLYEHHFTRHFGLGFGPVLNLNTYASIKTSYKQDGGSHKFVEKHIGQRKLTVDYLGVVHTEPLDFYVKYCPQDVLRQGPHFRSLTFGLWF